MASTLRTLDHWRRAFPGRSVHIGLNVVAMTDGVRSAVATGATAEEAASRLLMAWDDEPVAEPVAEPDQAELEQPDEPTSELLEYISFLGE